MMIFKKILTRAAAVFCLWQAVPAYAQPQDQDKIVNNVLSVTTFVDENCAEYRSNPNLLESVLESLDFKMSKFLKDEKRQALIEATVNAYKANPANCQAAWKQLGEGGTSLPGLLVKREKPRIAPPKAEPFSKEPVKATPPKAESSRAEAPREQPPAAVPPKVEVPTEKPVVQAQEAPQARPTMRPAEPRVRSKSVIRRGHTHRRSLTHRTTVRHALHHAPSSWRKHHGSRHRMSALSRAHCEACLRTLKGHHPHRHHGLGAHPRRAHPPTKRLCIPQNTKMTYPIMVLNGVRDCPLRIG